jgi:vitamin B12 transporter
VNNTKNHSPARAPRAPARLFPSFAFAGKTTATALAFAALIALATATTAPAARAQTAPLSTAIETSAVASIADDKAIQLGRYIVSASRTAQDSRYTPSSVTLAALEDFAIEQIIDLRTALGQVPGMNVSNTGPIGGPSSIFMRGANSDHTLFLVDGVRMNDRDASYTNFLGGADLGGIDRIEVLRGPQSTLYGSSAMGGVILIDTKRGCNAPVGSISAIAGSFDTWGAAASISGGTRQIGCSASLTRLDTANDLPSNDFTHWGYTTRLEYAPVFANGSTPLLLGGTFRGDNDEYRQTGSRTFYSPGEAATDNYLGTLYAQYRFANYFTSRLTGALHERRYLWTPQTPSAYNPVSDQHNKRAILDWQNTWQALEQLELVAGATYEDTEYNINGITTDDGAKAAYLSATARPVRNVTLTAGVRYDDFDAVGDATTWRTAAAWLPFKNTKLRASYGTGFNAPANSDRFGVASWGQFANPDIKPEESKGWDIGVEQSFLNNRITAGVTYFENHFENLFQWTTLDFVTYEGMVMNVSHAKTRGVEIATEARITDTIQLRLNYTYTDAKNTDTGARLDRRPRHVTDGEIRWHATGDFLIGAGVHGVSDRVDSGRMEDFTTVRTFASYTLRRANLTFKLRIENALDEKYDDVRGYDALPVGVFGGAEWKF